MGDLWVISCMQTDQNYQLKGPPVLMLELVEQYSAGKIVSSVCLSNIAEEYRAYFKRFGFNIGEA